mgnify:CR=1 FL=1
MGHSSVKRKCYRGNYAQRGRDDHLKRISWDEQQPGHFEVGLVHHCGPSASGEYVHTLQMIDVATGWSERVAVLERSRLVMEDAFRRILSRLPFLILEIHSDNGSEFFSLQDPVGNHHLLRFWREIVQGVQLSRKGSGRKPDDGQKEDDGHDQHKDRTFSTFSLMRSAIWWIILAPFTKPLLISPGLKG